ncbi:glycoside hydrolase family 28 protein [Lophiostoma macrostomum CBS 122681]|uniref:Glycoside hydrolase family 28 protein n=1 Tax=Lophiostoma macrostomum CBS 122681 TaxID=1314788 RepID=A0A6A6SXM6_9PLEO|nr:glycoside hydrolase family 28 protein [Lophiostoma macrostomum CBS 122681]
MTLLASVLPAFVLFTFTLAATAQSSNTTSCKPEVHPIPAEFKTRNTFAAKVRSPGSPWQDLQLWEVPLTEVNTSSGSSIYHYGSIGYFDFCTDVEVILTYNRSIDSVTIRPLSYNIQSAVNGNEITFMLSRPRNLVIEINGDIWDVLHLLSNTPDPDAPTGNSSSVVYVGPGSHSFPGGSINITSGQTLYLAAGAVLTSTINFYEANDVAVRGRGFLYQPPKGGILAENSSNILIDGVTIVTPGGYVVTLGQTENATIRNLHGFSSKGNGDGIDVFCSKNVLIESVFMRNSDDCIAIYAHRWNYWGDTRNVTVQDSSLWADLAHPINIGTHGNTDSPEVIEDLIIRNIDVLDHREPQALYQGTIALNPGDNNLVQHVLVDDFRVENFREGQLVNMRVMYNEKYNTSPGRGIHNVTIRNMVYNGNHSNLNVLVGYDEERTISFVQFINLTVNGEVIYDTMPKPKWYSTSDFVPMYANEHVKNLTFVLE